MLHMYVYANIYTAKGEENRPAQGKDRPSWISQGVPVDEGGSQEGKTGQVCTVVSVPDYSRTAE